MNKSPITYVLFVGYTIAWLLSANSPLAGLAFLMLLSLPVSIYQVAIGMFFGMVIGLAIAIVCILIPPLAPLAILVPLCILVVRIFKNIGPTFATILLYGAMLYFPHHLYSNELCGLTQSANVCAQAFGWIILFALGAGIVVGTLKILDLVGHSNDKAASFVLGFPGFLVSILLFFVKLNPDTGANIQQRHD